MITYRTSQKDVLNECKEINNVLLKRANGIDLKFKKWRKNNRSTEPVILQRSTYTINNNRVIAWWWGCKRGNLNFIDYVYLVETPNKDGSLRYIYHEATGNIVEFTAHFCKRLQERLCMTIFDLMAENIINYHSCFIRDEDDDSDDVVFCINGIHIMGVKNSDKYCTVTTVINEQQEYENQTEHKTKMDKVTKEYVKYEVDKQDILFSNTNFTDYNKFMSKKGNLARFLH